MAKQSFGQSDGTLHPKEWQFVDRFDANDHEERIERDPRGHEQGK
jgi:hypothetical protein